MRLHSRIDWERPRDGIAPSSSAAVAAAARPSSSESMHAYSSHFQPTAQQSDDPRIKKPWEYRIPEVLDTNLICKMPCNRNK